MAEIELAALANQRLADRIEDKATLARGVAAREADRNRRKVKARWKFTAADARV